MSSFPPITSCRGRNSEPQQNEGRENPGGGRTGSCCLYTRSAQSQRTIVITSHVAALTSHWPITRLRCATRNLAPLPDIRCRFQGKIAVMNSIMKNLRFVGAMVWAVAIRRGDWYNSSYTRLLLRKCRSERKTSQRQYNTPLNMILSNTGILMRS